MTVDATTATSSMYATGSATATATAPKKSLDGDSFLKLLVAQLKNQDPSSPMNTNEMMSQTTQLATMEQLTGLASTSRESFALQMRSSAAALFGKTVSYIKADGTESTGVVSAISYAAGVPELTIGKDKVALDTVSALPAPTTTTTSTSSASA